MSKKKRSLYKRFRLLHMTDKEKRDYITQSVVKTARKQRALVYGIPEKKDEAPAEADALENTAETEQTETEPAEEKTDSE